MGKTVCLDFDGVIHSYISGWQGAGVINDPPVAGIKDAIDEIRAAGYEVVIQSTRCADPTGLHAVETWLHENGIKHDWVTAGKPLAVAYIDERAIRFDGDAAGLLEKIETLKPWYLKGAVNEMPV